METENPRWKKTMGGAVDVDRLKKFAAQDDESDGNLPFLVPRRFYFQMNLEQLIYRVWWWKMMLTMSSALC